LGSRESVNRKELDAIQNQNVQIIWQCGKLYYEDYKNTMILMHVLAFIERMDLVYAAADVIISRAGLHQLSELCIWVNP
jgi:UDP-N-acetylglucosamine--N-acetylmuramyl-(pentapeptide) pyrophosphoryl-undecaprenol N-acetylglucosamine transferase